MSEAVDARGRANARQRLASDPAVSAFVTASAGSGKTKLLTDRLLRLLLGSDQQQAADPTRILCLTYTKAAAAEMALRLRAALAAWVGMSDADLDAALRALDLHADAELRDRARSLFARILDLPGGMRITTIHAFCQSLLRRFPLEAQLSPHFQLLEDAEAQDELNNLREQHVAAAGPHSAPLRHLAGLLKEEKFGGLLADLQQQPDRLDGLMAVTDPAQIIAALYRAAGASTQPVDALIGAAVTWAAAPQLAAALRLMQDFPGTTDKMKAALADMLDWLALPPAQRATAWDAWCKMLLTDGQGRQMRGFCTTKMFAQNPAPWEACQAEQARVMAVQAQIVAQHTAKASAALLALALPILRDEALRREHEARLDYAALIRRTRNLLDEPGAAWVLYKLDGGLDHLLLDEAQDTAPTQWEIVAALTAEFFAGLGANEATRTVFAVGDRKQSIFSFQGAAPEAFDGWRNALSAQVEDAGSAFRDVSLDVSFRSTTPILALVDAVFANPRAADGVSEPGQLHHLADRAAQAGRVELWPLAPRPDSTDADPHAVLDSNLHQVDAARRLADGVAAWLAEALAKPTLLPARGRNLLPGDVLILLRTRSKLAGPLVRALKARGVPIAGLDRMMLTDQPAVQDLLALCDVLLLPEDDLALACVLTSPLGGLDDTDLLALAPGRDGTSLWQILRRRAAERPAWQAVWNMLSTLLGRVDFVGPYGLLAEALGPLGGRARLFARLGPEAAEPVDELLNAALAWQGTHPASLQGFLHWLRQSGAQVKREAAAAGGAVRIMTVHGAKGLQAPLVILPDTMGTPTVPNGIAWLPDPQTGLEVPLWAPVKEMRAAALMAADAARKDAELREYRRLLYVAMTRAEDWLVVCGAQPGQKIPDDSWYTMIQRGFAGLATTTEAFRLWPGQVLAYQTPQATRVVQERLAAGASVPLPPPPWLGSAPDWRPTTPPIEPALPRPLAPSRPEGVTLGSVPAAASPLSGRENGALARGAVIHALLQHLPDLPPPDRAAAALDYARRCLPRDAGRPPNAQAGDAQAVAAQALAVLDHPDLAPLFGPGSRAEAPVAGVLQGHVVGGLIDRLAVLPTRILLADYKTNRRPPADVAAIPVLYLRQLAAYRGVLREIYPDRPSQCALIWTETGRIDLLPDALLDRHGPATWRA